MQSSTSNVTDVDRRNKNDTHDSDSWDAPREEDLFLLAPEQEPPSLLDSATAPHSPRLPATVTSHSPATRTTARTQAPTQRNSDSSVQIPHKGSLFRIQQDVSLQGDTARTSSLYKYSVEIVLDTGDVHELWFERRELDLMSRLFAILDTESRGSVKRESLQEFITLRCPVFWRRDEDLRKLDTTQADRRKTLTSPTFEEVWMAVACCSKLPIQDVASRTVLDRVELGVEGWMVFCRFIALAQYLEAKRQFSARHLQQTMRHRNSPRGSELVVVDVPPPEPPTRLSAQELADYERNGKGPLPLPELDLDHSLVAAHDAFRRRTSTYGCAGTVKISLFGSSSATNSAINPSVGSSAASYSTPSLEFAVTYTPRNSTGEGIVVRRSFADMKWLNDTFASHKTLGGTLCGRILPPFAGSSSILVSTTAKYMGSDDSSLKCSKSAVAAASAGVDMIASAAKSIWGSYLSPSSGKTTTAPQQARTSTSQSNNGSVGASAKASSTKSSKASLSLPESYYNPNSPVWKARQLERYLNYLLEHPALSTSFPLNTILKASQSGLEAAKLSIEDHAKSTKQSSKSYLAELVEGKLPIPFWSQESSTQPQLNLSWVRTAAQAAMALKVHGILETTGLPSASAKLQHASLPTFDNSSSRQTVWGEEDSSRRRRKPTRDQDEPGGGTGEDPESFEHGVIHVDSELGNDEEEGETDLTGDSEGYDLLPLPVPAPERRILSAGSDRARTASSAVESLHGGQSSGVTAGESKQARFHYGTTSDRERIDSSDSSQVQSAFLGEFSVDDNIDKLREVIGSVDNTLMRCLGASARIGGARRERRALHLDVVRGLDSWQGMRGYFITQRALLKGVSGLEQSRDVSEGSDLDMIDDISWQTSLARSAVSAAEDVRSTVRAARTAANAKAAADAAAFSAQNACETGTFATIDEARAAQTRSSIAQSHAIHATVIEHEANTAKKRAALALAHDVKCWNVHRKREVLGTCLDYARSQHLACQRAEDAWSCLRDGFLASATVTFTESKRSHPTTTESSRKDSIAPPAPEPRRDRCSSPDQEEVSAVIYPTDVSHAADTPSSEATSEPAIVPVDHDLLAMPNLNEGDAKSVTDVSKPNSETKEMDSFLDAMQDAGLSDDDTDVSGNTPGSPPKTTDELDERDILSASMQSLVDGLMTWGYDGEDDLALPEGMAATIAGL